MLKPLSACTIICLRSSRFESSIIWLSLAVIEMVTFAAALTEVQSRITVLVFRQSMRYRIDVGTEAALVARVRKKAVAGKVSSSR